MKYVVCYSGGHSSAIVAINAVLKYGKENVILLNHDISAEVETADIKRFKKEVAEYLGINITYANHENWETLTPIDNALKIGGWKFGNSEILCTYHLKTKPFYKWIEEHDSNHENVYLYGFDNTPSERVRMNKRIAKMGEIGCKTDYPLITWGQLEIIDTEQIGIKRPNNYENFAHANCQGCLKAGWQHWYIVYVHRRDLWEKAKNAELELGYSIHKDDYLEDKESLFEEMKNAGVSTTEHIPSQTFWSIAKKMTQKNNHILLLEEYDEIACTSCTG